MRILQSVLVLAALAVTAACSGPSTPMTPTAHQAVKRATACPCIYVANSAGGAGHSGSILAFPVGANGNVAPIQNITGAKTRLSRPFDVAVDANGNIYAISDGDRDGTGAVLIFAAGATGNVAPMAIISGSKTQLDGPLGIALNPVNGDVYVGNQYCSPSCGPGSITIYPPGSSGNVKPIGTIEGPNTDLDEPGGLALDAGGNIYVPDVVGGGSANQIGVLLIFPAGSTGNVMPFQIITGGNKVNGDPFQIALDANANMYVANAGNEYISPGFVEILAPGQLGYYSPSGQIAGTKTKLLTPQGIALDGGNNTYVANSDTNSLTVYAAGATGDPKPIRTIKGSATKLDLPMGMAIR